MINKVIDVRKKSIVVLQRGQVFFGSQVILLRMMVITKGTKKR